MQLQKLKQRNFEQILGENYEVEIKYLEANINYTTLYFVSGIKKISCYTLLRFEERLRANQAYKRINKTFIVNMNFVEQIDLNNQNLTINNGPVLQVSRRKMKELERDFTSFRKPVFSNR
ncbi:MAG: LytTR family DNA-binding domain-containing protein [Bacteroidota bacterium]